MVGNPLPDTSVPAKRGRGRPRKSDLTARQGEEGAPLSEPKQKRPRRAKGGFPPPLLDSGHVGQPVSGVLDGAFDAGYFVTVRIGDTDAVLRGVLFGPGFSMPLTEAQKAAHHAAPTEEPGNAAGLEGNLTPDSSPSPYVATDSLPAAEPAAFAIPVSGDLNNHATPLVTPTQVTAFSVPPVIKVEPENCNANGELDFENKGNASMDFEISKGNETLFVTSDEGIDLEPAKCDTFDFETFQDEKVTEKDVTQLI